jgi:Na+/alanine symporter
MLSLDKPGKELRLEFLAKGIPILLLAYAVVLVVINMCVTSIMYRFFNARKTLRLPRWLFVLNCVLFAMLSVIYVWGL